MERRHHILAGTAVLAVLLAAVGGASAAKSYADPVGDVMRGTGPDIESIEVSNTRAELTFRVRMAGTPPLRVNAQQGWVDMLLISIDVPPLGLPALSPGGEWPGANFTLGTHGPSKTGQLVRNGTAVPIKDRRVATFDVVTSGRTVKFTLQRRWLGNPRWFAFSVVAAREAETETEGGVDVAPASGAFRYVMTGSNG